MERLERLIYLRLEAFLLNKKVQKINKKSRSRPEAVLPVEKEKYHDALENLRIMFHKCLVEFSSHVWGQCFVEK